MPILFRASPHPSFLLHVLSLPLSLLACSMAFAATGHCTKGDCRNGWGTMAMGDGSTYIGQFAQGVRNGQGMLLAADGSKLVGIFQNDRFLGEQGDEPAKTDCSKDDSCEKGRGEIFYTDGGYYNGDYIVIPPGATTAFRFPDGRPVDSAEAVYLPHGFGLYKSPDHRLFEGEFAHGEPAAEKNAPAKPLPAQDRRRQGQEKAYATWLQKAEQYLAEDAPIKAATAYTMAADLFPERPEAYLGRARTFIVLGFWEEAVDDGNRLLAHDDSLVEALGLRARAFYELEQYQEAVVDLDRAIELDPANGELFYRRGLALDQLNRRDSALKDMAIATLLGHPEADQFLAQRAGGAEPADSVVLTPEPGQADKKN